MFKKVTEPHLTIFHGSEATAKTVVWGFLSPIPLDKRGLKTSQSSLIFMVKAILNMANRRETETKIQKLGN
jgi:hypothetical protein